MAPFRKLRLLLWKNYTLLKRHKIQTVVEIVTPIAFTALLVLIRFIVQSEIHSEPTTYLPFRPDQFEPKTTIYPAFFYRKNYTILYCPNDDVTNTIMERVRKRYFQRLLIPQFNLNNTVFQAQGFETESEMEAYYNSSGNTIFAAVVFKNDMNNLMETDYKLRFPATQVYTQSEFDDKSWHTQLTYVLFQLLGPRHATDRYGGEPKYYHEGFLFLQHAVDESVVAHSTSTSDRNFTFDSFVFNSEFNVILNRFPYPPYIDDDFVIALQGWIPLMLMLSLIYPAINITKNIVHEKEKRLKESMKMMGLANYLHWTAWFIRSFILLFISSIFIVILMKVRFYEDGNLGVITYSDGFILFLFLLIFIFSTITQAFFISTLFSTANSASTAAGVIFFATYLPYVFLQPRFNELSREAKMFSALLPNTGMAYCGQIISQFEGTGVGLQWDTIASGTSPDDDLSFLDCLLMLIIDGIILLIASWYIEGIKPGEFGVPLPWYFPFSKSYWLGSSATSSDQSVTALSKSLEPEYFEKEPTGKAGIQIQNLSKSFGKKQAVDGMSLNIYENQITVLLGHNGAGKTTTMSMLTGLYPPTSGTAFVNNFDIQSQINQVRRSLGICPQHDVLFDELTVEEHIKFFSLMKGLEESKVEEEVDRMVRAVGLDAKRSAEAQSLSGGMKRKLSVAIALCAGSKVVFLDEPTSGMDPGARRATWDLLQLEKKNRTLVLSTHFMEEADLLGDRIAIMANGKVQCMGSSLFLKKIYGGGYHLIIVKEPFCTVDTITAVLRKYIPDVGIDQNVGAELSYVLPDTKSHLFPDMFQELEDKKLELGIASYGASITTMEEVFIKVGRLAEEKEAQKNEMNGVAHDGHISIETLQENSAKYKLYEKSGDRNEGFQLLWQQFKGMFIKKMLYALRNKVLLIFQTIVPIFILTVTLVLVQTLPEATDPIELSINLNKYRSTGDPFTTLSCETNHAICNVYKNLAEENGKLKSTTNLTEFIISKSKTDLREVNYRYVVGMEFDPYFQNETLYFPIISNPVVRGYFNNQPFHTPPLALNFLTTMLFRYFSDTSSAMLRVTNHPLPLTLADRLANLGSFAGVGFQVGFNVAFGMAFLASSFVVFLIKERETKSKHLQFVSGVSFPIFWAAHFLFDVINYLIPAITLIGILLAFNTEGFNTVETLGNSFVLFLFYGFAVIPLMYLFSFNFTIPSSGFTRMILFNLFTGMISTMGVTILQIPDLDLVEVADVLDWICLLLPQYSLATGLIQISTNSQLHQICPVAKLLNNINCDDPESSMYSRQCCDRYPREYLEWHPAGIGRNLFFLFLVGFLSIVALFIYEAKLIQRFRYRKNKVTVENSGSLKQYGTFNDEDVTDPADSDDSLEDSDVAAENTRIRSTNLTQLITTETLVLRDLKKSYGDFVAVDRLCLGVESGQCFGLLGVNGAGKTSTFKILTGDSSISSGDAYIYGDSVKAEIKKVQKNLGYCPQFDALIDELTGRETLRLFARLRGVQEDKIDSLVDKLAAHLLFSEHINKRCGTYSGGNKRKLSTAIALVGSPPLVFLDEPTTGMDPVARRHLWNCVTNIRNAGTSIVLTSHSMEECEALCTRLSIMVNGKFRCLGSPQHLKNKFGEGYTLIAQMAPTDTRGSTKRSSMELGRRRSSVHPNAQPWERQLQPLKSFIEEAFTGAVLKDVHPGFVHYHVGVNAGVSWGGLFKKMEEAKARFTLEAYSVGQTSLEQVFLNFTKAQVNNED